MFGKILKGCGALSLLGVGLIIAIGVIGTIVTDTSSTTSDSGSDGSTSGPSPEQEQ